VTLAVLGKAVIVTDLHPCEPNPQALEGIAHTLPPLLPTVAHIFAVPWPEVIIHPDGTVQLKEIAPVEVAV
jgi:hypothetical protein